MSLSPTQFRDLIRRILTEAGLTHDLDNAVELLMLTAAAESRFGTDLRQIGGGPALGVFQMEPGTHDECWNFIEHKQRNFNLIMAGEEHLEKDQLQPDDDTWFLTRNDTKNHISLLEWNLAYAIIMARINYMRFPEPLPDKGDIRGMAEYWKKHWNTEQGKGTIVEAVRKYEKYVKERE